MFRVRSIHVIALALAVSVGLLTYVRWSRAATPAITRDTLASSFASDLRQVVYEWDPGDPRSEVERRRALFDFMHQTYDASAWIPQSLFDGNVVTQAVAGDVDTIVGEHVGLVRWRDNPLVPAFGMAPNAGDGSARSDGRSIAWSATRPRSTASPTSAPAARRSTSYGLAKR